MQSIIQNVNAKMRHSNKRLEVTEEIVVCDDLGEYGERQSEEGMNLN